MKLTFYRECGFCWGVRSVQVFCACCAACNALKGKAATPPSSPANVVWSRSRRATGGGGGFDTTMALRKTNSDRCSPKTSSTRRCGEESWTKAHLGALAEHQGRNHAVDDVLDPGVRVDLGVMDEHSSNWNDSHRRIAIDEYTSAPFDDDMLNGGHAANASPGGWGWFAVEGYDDIQHSQLFDEQVCP